MGTTILGCLLFLFSLLSRSQQKNTTLPIRISSSVLPYNGQPCSPVNSSAQRETVGQALHYYNSLKGPPCSCGGTGDWTRAAYLDMSDPTQQCPSSWTLVTSPVRGCGRIGPNLGDCDSVSFTVGRSYSKVCGKVLAIQKGLAAGFINAYRNNRNFIDAAYLDGVSLTHGAPGSRQHIWSFVGAFYEQDPNYRTETTCPCSNTNISYDRVVPTYMNNNYFCDTANRGPGTSHTIYYPDDPLWDGQGCGSTSSCCEFNNPPWFCTTLPQATSDDLEVRNCYTSNVSHEDKIITQIDIYVM